MSKENEKIQQDDDDADLNDDLNIPSASGQNQSEDDAEDGDSDE